MTAMPLPDKAFDLVASAFGCVFAPDPEAMAAELVRVCRPGGRIAVLAWTPDSAFGSMGPLAGAFLPGPGGGVPGHRWARPESIREVFAHLPVAVESTVRTVDVVWADLDQAMSEITDRNPAWLGIRAAVEPTGRWPELASRLRELLASHGRADAWFTLPVDYLETVATRT
jgi:SAM-dependent methyltransferase